MYSRFNHGIILQVFKFKEVSRCLNSTKFPCAWKTFPDQRRSTNCTGALPLLLVPAVSNWILATQASHHCCLLYKANASQKVQWNDNKSFSFWLIQTGSSVPNSSDRLICVKKTGERQALKKKTRPYWRPIAIELSQYQVNSALNAHLITKYLDKQNHKNLRLYQCALFNSLWSSFTWFTRFTLVSSALPVSPNYSR